MTTGIPLEVTCGEGRVAWVPTVCAELTTAGHAIYLETGAGSGSGYSDQGGGVENIQTTSYQQPVYRCNDILLQAVPNMPGAVPRTASQALSSAFLPNVAEILERGVEQSRLEAAIAVQNGQVVDPVLKEELGL